MKKVLFIDRDGTLIIEPADKQIDSLSKLTFFPGVISNLAKIYKEMDYEFVMVTNQDGLGTKAHPEENFWPPHNMMMKVLQSEGITFSEVLIDKTTAKENAPTRKPGTALLTHYMKGDYDLTQSFVIGDRLTDVELAENLNAKAIFITDKQDNRADFCTKSWSDIYAFLIKQSRRSMITRQTNETDITVKINLDGEGKADITTGIGFFDHMLIHLAKHAQIDLFISVKGDLHVDEHHSIEDTALALGNAFRKALGSKKGIQRYGFLLPMDDSLAQVAVDFSGRPQLVWNATFTREKIGNMPTEMFIHFFKSFCDTAKCNLNIRAEGENEHHKIEAIFKAFAKAVGMAIQHTGSTEIPSTKGVI